MGPLGHGDGSDNGPGASPPADKPEIGSTASGTFAASFHTQNCAARVQWDSRMASQGSL